MRATSAWVWLVAVVVVDVARRVAGCYVDKVDTALVKFVDNDAATRNFLFRTGLPLDKAGKVDVATLHTAFAAEAKAHNKQFFAAPTDYYLVDISFLGYPFIDDYAKAKEAAFFTNSSVGMYINWPLGGPMAHGTSYAGYDFYKACNASGVFPQYCAQSAYTRQPSAFSPIDRQLLAAKFAMWDGDKLDQRVDAVFRFVHLPSYLLAEFAQKTSKPLVIFGHCTYGCDRTGEFFGAYELKYSNNTTFAAVYNRLTSIPKPQRPITYPNQVELQWYCEYLHTAKPQRFVFLTDCSSCQSPQGWNWWGPWNQPANKPRCSCWPSWSFAPQSLIC